MNYYPVCYAYFNEDGTIEERSISVTTTVYKSLKDAYHDLAIKYNGTVEPMWIDSDEYGCSKHKILALLTDRVPIVINTPTNNSVPIDAPTLKLGDKIELIHNVEYNDSRYPQTGHQSTINEVNNDFGFPVFKINQPNKKSVWITNLWLQKGYLKVV